MNSKGQIVAFDPEKPKAAKGGISFHIRRRFPIGAEPIASGGVHFRVWAPNSKRVAVELTDDARFRRDQKEAVELEPEDNGYFSGFLPEARPGMLYKFRMKAGAFPDP